MHKRAFLIVLIGIATVLGLPAKAQNKRNGTITVFAAASLTPVITEAAQIFEAQSGTKARLSFASSSALARQIIAGASADLYLSANIKWMDHLAKQGLIKAESQTRFISNRLVLVAATYLKNQPIADLTPDMLDRFLGADGRLAMGDPDHVPIGLYGKQALEQKGLWKKLRTRIARADNARAALALIERGETPIGLVYRTDAMTAAKNQILYTFPQDASPIRYAFARTTMSETSAARDFLNFLISKQGLALFKKYGFVTLNQQTKQIQ